MAASTAHHVGLTVSDLESAVEFYQSVFDCSVVAEFSVAGDAFATGVGIDGASARFAHLDLGSIRLELVAYDPVGRGPSDR
jgi:Glyoxalase/Bleomycin resistance protein/Dioxygenase superfamily.